MSREIHSKVAIAKQMERGSGRTPFFEAAQVRLMNIAIALAYPESSADLKM